MKRTLHLRRESLGSLSDSELNGVVGGAYSGEGRISCALRDCVDTVTTAVNWSRLTLCAYCYTEQGGA